MGDSHHQAAAPSSLGIRHAGGEIVEVQGGHIVRSTGRKDRHSKVCTAKGPRDRRVRLSAHTAIQFYDVQDRLGYDRPSKAVDWLIKKAKPAIDELAELPPWNPETVTTTAALRTKGNTNNNNSNNINQTATSNEKDYHFHIHHGNPAMENLALQQQQMGGAPNSNSTFLPPSLDSDAIADTIKSFFPMGASAETPSSSIQFQSYPPDLLSRTSSQSQDLRLSLHSFQEPNLLLHQQAPAPPQPHHHTESVLFSGASQLGSFDGTSAGWEQHHQHPAGIGQRFQRIVTWNGGGADTGSDGGGGGGVGGLLFASPPQSQPLQPFFGQSNQLFSQRGPLQSSNTPLIRAWIDPPISAANNHHHQIPIHHDSAIPGVGFAAGGFSGFRIPARIQGDEEEHDGIPNKPSSASSNSRH